MTKQYERLRRLLIEQRIDRHGKVLTCVLGIAAVALLVRLHYLPVDNPEYDQWFAVALFALLVAGLLACITGVYETARIIMQELERVKCNGPTEASASEKSETDSID